MSCSFIQGLAIGAEQVVPSLSSYPFPSAAGGQPGAKVAVGALPQARGRYEGRALLTVEVPSTT